MRAVHSCLLAATVVVMLTVGCWTALGGMVFRVPELRLPGIDVPQVGAPDVRVPNPSALVPEALRPAAAPVPGAPTGGGPPAAASVPGAPTGSGSPPAAAPVPPTGSGAPAAGGGCGAQVCVQVEVAGAVQTTASLRSRMGIGRQLSCTDWSRSGPQARRMPLPPLHGVSNDGVTVTAANWISGYQGPGEYDRTRIRLAGLPAGVILDQGLYTASGTDSSVRALINADGSGALTFTNLRRLDGDPGATISGSIRWTCQNSVPGTLGPGS